MATARKTNNSNSGSDADRIHGASDAGLRLEGAIFAMAPPGPALQAFTISAAPDSAPQPAAASALPGADESAAEVAALAPAPAEAASPSLQANVTPVETGITPTLQTNDTLSATQTTVLVPGAGTDLDGDGVIDPGDTVVTTVTITNNSINPSALDATGVQFTEILDGMTQTGSINVSPIAFGESFAAIGNTLLEVGNATAQTGPQKSLAGSVTANDVEFFGDNFTISAFQATSAQGGTVTMITSGADMGSFTYVSAPGFTGTGLSADTFTYTIRDDGLDGIAGNADDLTSTATVRIDVADQVWYISAGAAGTNQGTSANPFNSIASFNAAAVDGANDYIYIQGTNTGALTLEASEQLIGTGNDLVVGAFTLATSTGTNTLINNSASGITLATNNTIKGVTVNGTDAAAVGIQDGGGTVGTLVIDNVSLSGTGKAIDIDQGGALNVDIDSLSSASSATEGVHLQGVSGSFNAAAGHIQTSTGQGFLIGDGSVAGTNDSGGTATISYGGDISSSTGTIIEVRDRAAGSGTVTFSGTITDGNIAAGGRGLYLDDNAGGTISFTGQTFLSAGGSTGTGIHISDNAAAVSFAPTGTGLDITTGSGTGLLVSSNTGTLTITGAANSITSTTGTLVNVLNSLVGAGGINLGALSASGTVAGDAVVINNLDNLSNSVVIASLSLASGATGDGIDISNSNAAFTFTGAVNIANGAGGRGVVLDNNDGGSVTFSGGGNGLDIVTAGGDAGFTAINGGTVTVQGAGNTISSGTGTALNISNTDIGANDVTFQSIGSSGGSNTGIILDTTGSAGGLHVTGTGAAGTGGTIASKTGAADGSTTDGIGIYLNNTTDVQLDRMQLNDFSNYAIRGVNVTGFILDHSVINGVNGTNAGSPFNEGSVSFSNLLGSASIANTSISGGFSDNIRLVNTSGTLNRLTLTNDTIGANSLANGNDGMTVEAQGTANVNVTVQNSFFTSSRGDLFQFSAPGSGTSDLIFTGNALSNNHGGIATGGGGVTIGSGSTSVFTFNIASNTFRDAVGHAVLIVKDVGSGSMTGAFNNNTIGVIGVANSGSLEGAGIKLQHAGGGGKIDVDIINNDIHRYNNEGILLQAGAGVATSGTFIIEVASNLVSNPGTNPSIGSIFQGFALNSGVTPGDSFVTYLTLGGDGAQENIFTGSGRNGGVDMRIRARQDTDVHLTANDATGNVPAAPNATYHYTGGLTDAAAVATFLAPHNSGTQSHAAFDNGQFRGDSPPAPASSPPKLDGGETAAAIPVQAAPAGGLAQSAAWAEGSGSANQDYSNEGYRTLGGRGGLGLRPMVREDAPAAVEALAPAPASARPAPVEAAPPAPAEAAQPVGAAQPAPATAAAAPTPQAPITPTPNAGGTVSVGPADSNTGVFTLPAGQQVIIQWRSTIDPQSNQLIDNPVNTGTVSATNAGTFPDVNTNTVTTTLDTLVLGGTLWRDNGAGGGTAGDGLKQAGEPTLDGVLVSLFVDANDDNVADTPGTSLLTTTTAGGGNYSFTGLAPGNYIVRVDADNFTTGGNVSLVGHVTTLGNPDPDNGDPDTDDDDNGYQSGGPQSDVFSNAITLAYNTEPTAGMGNDTNNTLDFGFFDLNAAPTETGLAGDTVTYTEQQPAPALLDLGSNGVISDADSANFDLGTLTVSISAGLVAAEDQLVITNTGGVTFTANTVSVGVTQIATYTGGGAGGGNLVFTFDADATPAAVTSLVRALGYNNSAGDRPTDGNRTISWTLVDGDGTAFGGQDTLNFTTTVNVDPVNDDPVVPDSPTIAAVEQVAITINPAITVSDADLDLRNGGAGDYGGAQFLMNRNTPDTDDLFTIDPTGASFTISGALLLSGGLEFANYTNAPSGLNITFTSTGTAATTALVNDVLRHIQYTNTSDTPDASITVLYSLIDGSPGAGQGAGGTGSGNGQVIINITDTPENVPPTIDLDGDNSSGAIGNDYNAATYNEGDPTGVFIADGDVVIADGDGDDIVSATVSVQSPEASDRLRIDAGDIISGYTVTGNDSTMLTITADVPGPGSADDIETMLAAVRFLNIGDNPGTSRTISTTVTDGIAPGTAALTNVTIVPSNDPAAITGDALGSVQEAGGVANGTPGDATDTGDLDHTDVDNTADVWQAVAAGGTTANGYGTYALTAAGVWTYTLDDSNAAVQALNGAATLTDTFTALTEDGTSQVVTITITAQNDNAVITGDALGSVQEAGGVANGTPGDATDTGDLDHTDVDNTADVWQAVAAGGTTANGYGTYALTAAGVWTYTLDDSNAAVQALNGAATLTDTFTALTEDGTSQVVTITITAQNDNAVITGDALGSVQEAGGVANGTPGDATDTGDLDHTDVDNTADVWQAVAAGGTTANGYGTYALTAAGVWTYTLDDSNAAVQALNGAATLTDTFTALTEDGTSQVVTITITAQNDNAVITGDALGSVQEAGGVANGTPGDATDTGDLDHTDVDNTADVWQAVAAGGTTANGYGTYALTAAGVWTYTLDDSNAAVQALNGAATLTDTFTALTEDGTSQVVTITITAQNDNAVITGDALGSVQEAGGVANGTPGDATDTGDLDHTDVDNTADVWQAVAAGGTTANGYGTYALTAAGVWTYTLDDSNAAVQALNGAATLTDTFTALTEDGTSQVVTITITAQNDAPTIDDLDGDTTNYVENAPPVRLDFNLDAAIADLDSPDFDGGILQATIASNYAAGQDLLGITVSPTTTVTLSNGTNVGSVVSVGGTAVGTITTGSAQTIAITLNANASQANVTALARALNYSNTSEAPNTLSRGITVSVTDGDGSGPISANTLVTLTSVNDAPSSTGGSVTGSEDDPYVFTLADFNFSDPAEGHGFAGVVFTTVPTIGTLFYDADGPGGAAPVALADGAGPIAAADIAAGKVYFLPVTDAFGSPYTSFTFRVQDNGGILNGGVDTDPTPRTMTINVTPDNLAPAVDLDGGAGGIDASVSYTEGAPGVSIGSGIAVSDPNEGIGDQIESATITLTDAVAGDALTVTLPLPGGITAVTTTPAGQIVVTLSGPASTADYAAAIAQILYSTTSQDPTFGGADPTRTITVTVNDGMLTSAVATSTVTIMPLDDAAVAQPDAFTTNENAVLNSNVFPDNGSGADSDVDGPALQVGAVNGMAVVGSQIALASGALLTVNANGTFSYNPNGAFNTLPDFVTSGASNTTAPDSFNYTLVNGNTVTVSLTVRGVDSDGDILLGTPGVDSLDGGIGADTMTGFAGDDTYFVDNAGDTVVEAAGEGSDTIRSSVGYTLAAGLSIETLTTTSQAGTTAIDLAGNEIDNRIEGNDGVNILTGNDGFDRLFGHGGGDTLNGGAGNDELDGGAGIDRALFAGSLGFSDTLAGWVITSSEGNDFLENVEIAVGGTGQRNLLVGSTGFAALQDALIAAQTDDNVRLAAGSYSGTVSYDDDSLAVVGQPNSQQNVTYTTATGFGISVVGADLGDTITTGDGDDVVLGRGGNDTISTGGGNDTLSGGAGDDTMSGGAGNDIYHVGEAGDVVIEAIGGGIDIIYSAVSYSLNDGQEVEGLATISFTATNAINLTGNGLDNYMIGNDGSNQLDGKGGADVMVGRAGADVYIVDNAGDEAIEDAGGGIDVIYTSVSYSLVDGQEVESLSTIDWGAITGINLTGNSGANSLNGNAGSNILDGKGGSDVLQGREGADRFDFTTALGAGNVDNIFDFATEDTIALESDVFGLGEGPLDPNAFVVGTAATADHHRIVYDQASGYLYFDADGSGNGAAILFASLTGAPALTASDFIVI